MGDFSTVTSASHVRLFFEKKWNLPWEHGDYFHQIVPPNRNLNLDVVGMNVKMLQVENVDSVVAIFLANVPQGAAVYLPASGLKV